MSTGYPRPDFDRSPRWSSLDGEWDFFPDPAGELDAARLADAVAPERIAVPGPWEESATGGRHDWLEHAWYRRALAAPADWAGERVFLVVGAAFHEAEAWIGGQRVGGSASGYLPWEADVTDALRDGAATLLIRVTSPRDKRDVPHGKQRSIPHDDYDGCSFTPASGIWQSVWLEPRPAVHLRAARLTPTPALDGIRVDIRASAAAAGTVTIEPEGFGPPVTVPLAGARATAVVPVAEPRLWSPEDPHLLHATLVLRTPAGEDRVRVYTGLRRFEAADGEFRLNGRRIYLRGVLDQGYWPGSGLTPPDEAALVRDLELARACGFNLVRKHLKPEDPRWLYHADRLGMLVWAEPASTGRFSEAGAQAFERELAGLVERDANHPSIVIWGAYNEEWGLDWNLEATPAHTEAVRRAVGLVRGLDPTRPAIDNSGWSHVDTDVVDWHYYNEDPARFGDAIAPLLSGAPFDVWNSAAYPVAKTLAAAGFVRGGQPLMNSEYGGGWNSVERAWHTRWQTQFLRLHPDNQGYVYTELYDIEHETVGIFTFDRAAKDQDGFVQRWAHAETVIVPLLCPLRPGADLVASPGAPLAFKVRISHTGPAPLRGRLEWSWDGVALGSAAVTAAPFGLSQPVEVTLVGPAASRRLHLRVLAEGLEAARTFVDLVPEPPTGHLPPDSGWRPPHQEGAS